MKKMIFGCMLLALFSTNVSAAGAPKIGFVSVEKILSTAPQVEAVNTAMLERFGGKREELQALETEIKTMQENYKRNELVMTEDKLAELRNAIIAKVQSYKQMEAVLTQEVSTMRSQELAVLQKSVRTIIQDIAKAGGYDLVLSEGIVYANDSLDISDQVLEKMNQQFKEEKK